MSKDLAADTQLSHYRIVSKIGAGGMGEVYLAEDTRLDRKVAVKLLGEEVSRSDDRLRRFVQEAKAASALNHPNIITVYDIGRAESGAPFIATEYIEGETLRHLIQRSGLKVRVLLDIAVQVASALTAAHAAGIVHRDIKPENVMVRPDGITKVLDFGLAKLTEKARPRTDSEAETVVKQETDPGMVMGTVQYMSPEQARGREVDARSDIFSLGIVLYELIAGRPPFVGESSSDVLSAILDKEPPPLARFIDDLPQELQRIVTKCLRKERDERYQTMKDVLLDLRELRDELALEAKLERSIRPVSKIENQQTLIAEGEITQKGGQQTRSAATVQTTSSAEYLISEIKQHKRGVAVASLIALLAVVALSYWYFFNRSAGAKQIESIAVMPFINESGNADIDYLSDGMTETLISSLSNIPSLSVKARSTVFYYKGKEITPKRIGEELNVQAVLLGRVVQRGDDLKLNLELVNTRTQDVIWSEQYNRKKADLVSLQNEIARDVLSKLKTRLSGPDEARVTRNFTANVEAYQHYLKGRFYWNKRDAVNLKKAIEQFRLAADKDPNYALAYVGLADSYALLEEYAGTPPSESLPQARAYAQRALQIDESLGEAHASLGLINHYSWQWADAEKEYRRAIDLNPNYPSLHQWYSNHLRDRGQLDKALAEIKLAQELDPLSGVIGFNVGILYMLIGDHTSAIEKLKKTIELHPDWWGGHHWLGFAYLKLGRTEEAIVALQKSAELSNRSNRSLGLLGHAYGVSGKRREALAILKELEDRYSRHEGTALNVAFILSGLSDKEQFFAWMEKGFQDRSGELIRMTWYLQIDSLRDDPRYQDLVRRLGLPELK